MYMLVSHLKKFIYLKTVKSASTTTEIYFQSHCSLRKKVSRKTGQLVDEKGIIASRGAHSYLSEWHEHMKAAEVKEKIGDDIWNNYFKFCTVRNPYERAVSWFYFRPHPKDFSEITKDELIEYFESYTMTKFASDREIYCIDGVASMDDYIKVENFHDDMARVCYKLEIDWTPETLGHELSHYRPSQSRPKDLFTEESKKHIRELCAFEIEMFGYRFPHE